MDTFVIQAIAQELKEHLLGARLDRISQADAHTILLFFSVPQRGRRCLLISADPAHPRIHLTSEPPPILPEAPAFCRTLRKYLGGLRIARAAAGEWERVLQFSFSHKGVSRPGGSFALMAEMMGRWSNLILLDGGTGEILDAKSRIARSRNPSRPLERGGRYQLPPVQKKVDPNGLTRESMRKMITESNLQSATREEFARWLVGSVGGVSPSLAWEIARVSWADDGWTGAAEALLRVMETYRRGEFTPVWVLDADGQPVGLSAVQAPVAKADSYRAFGSMNEAADLFYRNVLKDFRLGERKRGASKILCRVRERIRGAIDAAQRDLESAAEAACFLRKGELLLENLGKVDEKAKVLSVQDASGLVEIALDPRLTPSENAQKYFHRYKKRKRRASFAMARLQEMEKEEEFINSLTFDLETAEEMEDIASVEEALSQAGYFRWREKRGLRKHGRAKGGKTTRSRNYRRFLSASGWEVIVGKNALGNDEMLRSVGRASDMWFHAQGVPGSHVLLRRAGAAQGAPDEDVLVNTAAFAAYFSRSRTDSKLPVDYLPFPSLRRPRGGRPGQVLFTGHKTILVDPDLGRRLCGEWEEIS